MEAPAVFIGERQRDLVVEQKAEARLAALFPQVSFVTTHDGAKFIPLAEVFALESVLKAERDAAFRSGHQQGLVSGTQKGLDEARQVAAQFDRAINDAVGQRETMLIEAKEKILDLVLKISKKVTFEAIELDKEALLTIIEGAVAQLVDRSRLKIKVHPSFLPVVQRNLDRFLASTAGIRDVGVEPDPRVHDGGCLIETPSGDIDARLESQFEVIAEALQGVEERR